MFKNSNTMHGPWNKPKIGYSVRFSFLSKAICKTCFDEKIPELHLTPESVTSKDLEVM